MAKCSIGGTNPPTYHPANVHTAGRTNGRTDGQTDRQPDDVNKDHHFPHTKDKRGQTERTAQI